MSDRPEYSAIILAGGRSSRMGRPKAELSFDGGTMLDYIVAEMMRVFEDLVVAVAEPKLFAWEGYGARSSKTASRIAAPFPLLSTRCAKSSSIARSYARATCHSSMATLRAGYATCSVTMMC